MTEPASRQRWILAMTGASGACYGVRLLDVLSQSGAQVEVVCSEAALRVLADELDIQASFSRLSSRLLLGEDRNNIRFHNVRDIGAAPASGSTRFDGMVIAPCSMGTLAAVAHGMSQNLIQRAADVTLKEGRRLVIAPRESPLSAIHLENMLTLSRAGARIVPLMPGFYHRPAGIDELVEMMVQKLCDSMGLTIDLVPRWDVIRDRAKKAGEE